MQSWRTAIGLIGAALPVAYCVGMVWYFADLGGWDDPVLSTELQPTIIGLGIVGFLFVLGLAWRIRRAFGGSAPRGPAGGAGGGRAFDPGEGDTADNSDTDAMIARYLAERDGGDAPRPAAPARPAAARSAGASFGRRGLSR